MSRSELSASVDHNGLPCLWHACNLLLANADIYRVPLGCPGIQAYLPLPPIWLPFPLSLALHALTLMARAPADLSLCKHSGVLLA